MTSKVLALPLTFLFCVNSCSFLFNSFALAASKKRICPAVVAGTPLDPIETFINQLPLISVKGIHPDPRVQEAYKPFLTALIGVNLNSDEPIRIKYRGNSPLRRKPNLEPLSFVIDPRIVQGWRQLGLVDKTGNFNFAAKLPDIMAKFVEITGFRVVPAPGEVLNKSKDYFGYIQRTEFFDDDIHSILFHLPYLLSPIRRTALQLAAEFTEIDETWELNGLFRTGELLNRIYEGPVDFQPAYKFLRENEVILYGPAQVEFATGGRIDKSVRPRADLNKLLARYISEELFENYPNRYLDDRIEMKIFLLTLAQDLKNWQAAYMNSKTIKDIWQDTDGLDRFQRMSLKMAQNSKLKRDEKRFLDKTQKLRNKIEAFITAIDSIDAPQ